MDKKTFETELKKFADPYLESLGIDDVVDVMDNYIINLEIETGAACPFGRPTSIECYNK